MIRSRCLYSLIVTCTVLFPMATPALAQGERRFYVGAELGTLLSSAVTMTGDSNDRASICDEFINPLYASVPGCTDAARGVGDSWSVPFDGAGGVAMSAVMGYRLHGMVRAEVEYVMRSSNYSQRSGVLAAQGVNADKLSDELFLAQEWLGLVESKSLMGNVYLDLPGVAGGFTVRGVGYGDWENECRLRERVVQKHGSGGHRHGSRPAQRRSNRAQSSRHVQLGAGHHGGYTDQLPNSRWIRLPGVGNGVGRTQGSLDEVG